MKHPPRVNGLALATLALLVAASVGCAASPAAAATGPTVTVQVNGTQRSIGGGIVQLGTAPMVVTGSASGELSKIECSGLSPGELPADSVGAALLALGDEWTVQGLHGGGTLTFAGEELPMQSISYKKPSPGEYEEGWQLWAGERYYDLGSGAVLGLCATLREGETVLLQSSELVATSAPSAPAPYSTDTPHIQIEGVPTSVVVGQRFTVTVAAFEPSEWAQNSSISYPIWRTTGAGYSVSLDGAIPVQTNASGEATLTATAADAGTASLVALAGDSSAELLPTREGSSALSAPASVHVYAQAGELSAPGAGFGAQPLDTVGFPQAVVVAAVAGGGAQITGVKVAGADAEDFLIGANGCTGATVNSETQATCMVGVRFAPSAVGARSATLVVSSTAANGTLEVPLTGTGGSLPSGAQGQAGPAGLPGTSGENGANGAQGQVGAQGPAGAQGLAGAQGPPGAQGPAGARGPVGASGPRGAAGRDAICKVVRGKGVPRITCTLPAHDASSARATLTRAGHTYARGTVSSLLATRRRLPAGRYTLHYGNAGRKLAVTIALG